MTLKVELVSPERILLSAEASMVVARTIRGGDIAFLTDHAPFVGALDIWPLEVVLTDGTTERAAVHGGFISVADNEVRILSDLAELAGQIDIARAEAARDRAEAAAAGAEDEAQVEAAQALARATARLTVATAASTTHA